MRHEGMPEAAFVEFDMETLLPIEGAEPFITNSVDSSLSWMSEETVKEENTETGHRFVRDQAFFSDG